MYFAYNKYKSIKALQQSGVHPHNMGFSEIPISDLHVHQILKTAIGSQILVQDNLYISIIKTLCKNHSISCKLGLSCKLG